MTQLSTTMRRARKSARVLAPYGRSNRRDLVEGWVATLVLVAARLAFPWPLRGVMDEAVNHKTSGRAAAALVFVPSGGNPAVWLIGAFLVIVIAWGASEWRQRLSFSRYAAALSRNVQAAAINRLPRAHRKGVSPGELISTVTSDCTRLKSGVKSVLVGTTRNGLFSLGVAVILMLINTAIGLIFLFGALGSIVLGGLGAWRSSMVIRRSLQRDAQLTQRLHHQLSGQQNAEPFESRPATAKVSHIEGLTTFAAHAVLAISTCAILALTIHDARVGAMSPGAAFTVLAYILFMHNKTVALGRNIVRAGRVLPSAERLARLIKSSHPPGETTTNARPRPLPNRPSPKVNVISLTKTRGTSGA